MKAGYHPRRFVRPLGREEKGCWKKTRRAYLSTAKIYRTPTQATMTPSSGARSRPLKVAQKEGCNSPHLPPAREEERGGGGL